jgi:hypothetical protein
MPFYARPNALVAPDAAAAVSSASSVGTAWTLQYLGTLPAGMAAGTMEVDVVRATPGFETLASAALCLITLNSPSNYTFELTCEFEIVEGDYICLPAQAPVPQVPVELHGLLAARTARRLLKAVGDDRWQSVDADVQELEGMALKWLAPRVAGQTQQSGGSIGSSGIGPFGGAWWWAT